MLAGADQEEGLKCVDEGRRHGLIQPLLIGDKQRIVRLCRSLRIPLAGVEIVDEPDPKQAAIKAVALCRDGHADILMKGNVNTDVILRAILDRESGLGRGGLLSNITVFELPAEKRLMFMSDPAVNINPDVARKVDMVRNAIWVAQRLGFARPKVAVLAAIEKINVKDMPATADAAMLAKMGEAGQFADADIAGPYALDIAVSRKAAECKHITGPVAGCADILLVSRHQLGKHPLQVADLFRRPGTRQRHDRRENAPGDELPLRQRPDEALHDGPVRRVGGREQ